MKQFKRQYFVIDLQRNIFGLLLSSRVGQNNNPVNIIIFEAMGN